MRAPASDADLLAAIGKTGFPLEYKVASEFRKTGWNVLGGRYYVDDVDGAARELDLVAYKLKKRKDVNVVTAVLVSCKKDAEGTWAFLSRERPEVDPNFDWSPVHVWSDVEPLRTFLATDDWKEDYVGNDKKARRFILESNRDIFAFQQVTGTAPRNDRAIFSAVSGLLKAQDFELNALPQRSSKKNRLYVFHLVVVVDAPMVDVSYDDGNPSCSTVGDLLHLARYMVKQKHVLANVLFVRADKLAWLMERLDHLAQVNAQYFSGLVANAYDAISHNGDVRDVLCRRIEFWIRIHCEEAIKRLLPGNKLTTVEYGWSKSDGALTIMLGGLDDAAAAVLERDEKLKRLLTDKLKQIRYTGDFMLVDEYWDIPF